MRWTEWRTVLPEMQPIELPAVTLGDSQDAFTIRGMNYESPSPAGGNEWLAVHFAVNRDGETLESVDAFMVSGDLIGLAEWLEGLADRAAIGPGTSTHLKAGPLYHFDDPVEIDALSWGPDAVRLRVRWYHTPPWELDELTAGSPSLVVTTGIDQLREFAATLRLYGKVLPDREEARFDWMTPLALTVLVVILALIILGAVTAVRWVIATLG